MQMRARLRRSLCSIKMLQTASILLKLLRWQQGKIIPCLIDNVFLSMQGQVCINQRRLKDVRKNKHREILQHLSN